jgi:cbb3-type cytochrome oxidase subunit 3
MVPDTFPTLFWGYAAMFGCFMAYLVFVVFRIHSLSKRINSKRYE